MGPLSSVPLAMIGSFLSTITLKAEVFFGRPCSGCRIRKALCQTVRFPVVHAQYTSYASSVPYLHVYISLTKACQLHQKFLALGLFEQEFQ